MIDEYPNFDYSEENDSFSIDRRSLEKFWKLVEIGAQPLPMFRIGLAAIFLFIVVAIGT